MSTLLFFLITITAVLSRLHGIDEPNYVCWDETHFGRMAGMYINRTYFADVHPPLGKLIIAFIGMLSGFDGKYGFENPGGTYLNNTMRPLVPYMQMRMGCAFLGAMVIPIVYLIVFSTIRSETAAFLSSVLLMCDVAMVTISRYMLLDPIMLFFMFSSILLITKLSSFQNIRLPSEGRSFGLKWWLWLLLGGLFLGCLLAVKMVGLFTVLFLGLWVAVDLWNILGNVPVTGFRLFFNHLMARIFGLILIPSLVYFGIFYIHFAILSKTGVDSIFHSTLFQASLIGNPLFNTSISMNIKSRSSVTIRNSNSERMFLHSHKFFYPGSSQDAINQQVTGYMMRDGNNLWTIEQISNNVLHQRPIRSGNRVRLIHRLSNKTLSLPVDRDNFWIPAPLNKWRLMVSALKSDLVADNSDQWTIQLFKTPNDHKDDICTIDCYIQFHNKAGNCYLCSSNKVLPQWGKKQHEIICSSSQRDLKNCVWFIEEVIPSSLSDTSTYVIPPMSMFGKFLEIHQVMLKLNSKLLKKPGEPVSKPWHWLINYKPKLFSKPEDKRYLAGTPLIWHLNLVIMPVYCIMAVLTAIIDRREVLRIQQNVTELSSIENKHFSKKQYFNDFKASYKTMGWYFLGWAIHYLPFFAMSRVLFFHHYLPAHVFACMLSGAMIDKLCISFTSVITSYVNVKTKFAHHCVVIAILSVITRSFFISSHLCYGRNNV